MLAAHECAEDVLESHACYVTDTQHPRVVQFRKEVMIADMAVNFACRDNVEGTVLTSYHIHCYIYILSQYS